MTDRDFRQRFVFDQLDVRGCLVRLEQTTSQIQATHHYPPALARLLNEFALAAALLRDSIKIDGSLTIQLRSPGALQLLIADCLADRRIRAIAEYDSHALAASNQINLNELGEGSVLAITINPTDGERYQSIVPIEQASLSACLEDYFSRSEQLPSQFSLHTNEATGLGIALHALPPEKEPDRAIASEKFEHLSVLLNSLSVDEALSLSATEILTRLFHDEHCRLFEAHAIEFGCECSEQKSLDAIAALGRDEVKQLIEEQRQQDQGKVVVDCHFCFQRYEFEFSQLDTLFQ